MRHLRQRGSASGDWRRKASTEECYRLHLEVPASGRVVVDHAVDGTQRDTLTHHIVTLGLDCPWAGLEYVVYQADAVRAPAYPLPYLLNVNAGPRRDSHVTTAGDPALSQAFAARHAPTTRLDHDKVAAFLARVRQRADDHPFR